MMFGSMSRSEVEKLGPANKSISRGIGSWSL